MEGGFAILLLLVLVVIGAGFALAFTSLGTALGLRSEHDEKAEGDEGRPVHDKPTTPYHEHVRFTRPEHHESEMRRR